MYIDCISTRKCAHWTKGGVREGGREEERKRGKREPELMVVFLSCVAQPQLNHWTKPRVSPVGLLNLWLLYIGLSCGDVRLFRG